MSNWHIKIEFVAPLTEEQVRELSEAFHDLVPDGAPYRAEQTILTQERYDKYVQRLQSDMDALTPS